MEKRWLPAFSAFRTMFSNILFINPVLITFNLLSSFALNSDKSKCLLFDKEFILFVTTNCYPRHKQELLVMKGKNFFLPGKKKPLLEGRNQLVKIATIFSKALF